MKKSTKIIISVTTIFALSAIIVISEISRKRRVINEQRDQVAEEGYETAYDILFPLKKSWMKVRYR